MEVKTEVLEYEFEHDCGYPIRIRQEFIPTIINVHGPEMHLQTKLTYTAGCGGESYTHCPICGKAFPGHEAKVENFLENPVTDSVKLGNE